MRTRSNKINKTAVAHHYATQGAQARYDNLKAAIARCVAQALRNGDIYRIADIDRAHTFTAALAGALEGMGEQHLADTVFSILTES